ncbi:Protein purity of essence [Schistosoma japonicum]|nr:Protein purity of essence [Schistosoma japonicum]KAH8855356.1 Protein purity of essence [Schistosoma japonicum]
MWGFSENLEDDVLLTLALQLSLRDQGGSSTRDDVGENNQQSVDTPRLQSISQEVVTIRENENVNQMELNNEQDFEEFSQLADSTGWSVESGVPETNGAIMNSAFQESSNQSAVETTLQNPYHGEIDVEYVTSVATEEEDFPGLYSLFEETTLSPKAVELACLDKAHSRSLHTATSINSTANTSTNRNKNRNVCIKSEEMLLTDAADSRSISSTNMSSDGNNDDISNDSAPESNILRNSYRYDNLKSLYYSTSVSLDDVDDNNESAFADSGDDVHDSARNSNIDVFPSDTDYHHHQVSNSANNSHFQANNSSENNNEPNDNKQISFLLKSLTKSLLSSKYRRQNLALLFCLNMSNYLSTEWLNTIKQFTQSKSTLTDTSPGSSQHFVPVLQFIICLVRILHANACQLNAEIIVLQHQPVQSTTVSTFPSTKINYIGYQNRFYLEYIKQLLHAIKTSLEQLIRTFVNGLLQSVSVVYPDNFEEGESIRPGLNDVNLRENVEQIVHHSNYSLLLEFIILQLYALIEIFGFIPSSLSHSSYEASHSLSLIHLWLYDEYPVLDNCGGVNQMSTPSSSSTSAQQFSPKPVMTAVPTTDQMNLLSNKPELRALIDQTIEFCLTLLETLYTRLLKIQEEASTVGQGSDVKQSTHKTFISYPNAIINPTACGLLQGSLYSLQNSGDTPIGTSASGLLSWLPLISSSHCLDYIGNPMMSQLGWLATRACVKLPYILLYFLSSTWKDKNELSSGSGSSGKPLCHSYKISYLSSESESRWCSVLFNYKELISHPNLFQSQFTTTNLPSTQHQRNDNSDISTNTPSISNNLFQFMNLESAQQSSKLIYPLERELQSLLVSIVGPKSYRQLHDVHRLTKLLQRIRDICVNTGGLVLHDSCGSMLFSTSGTSPAPTYTFSDDLLTNPTNPTASTNDTQLNPNFSWSPSHYQNIFARQLRLPYIAQREILENISSCLAIAMRNTAYWQRLCLRSSGTLLFLLHTSLVLDRKIARNMLYLIQLAICSGSVKSRNHNAEKQLHDEFKRSACSIQSTEMKLSRIIASNLIVLRHSTISTCSEINSEENTSKSKLEHADLQVSSLLVQFIRTFLCRCPEKSIRDSTAHILSTIFSCVSREAQSQILSLITLLWPELSTFVPYSSQFVHLSIYLLNSYPNWSGRAKLIEQVIWILMQRLEALKRYPNRTLYSVLMHFAYSQTGLLPGVFIPSESTEQCGSFDRSTNEFTFLRPTTITTTDSSTSRSWASVVAQKPNTSQSSSINSSSGGFNGMTETSQFQTDFNRNLPNNLSTSISASNSPFTFELEPCLLCHAKVIDEPFYVTFRWDSEPSVSRRSIQSVVSTIYSSRFAHQFRQSPLRNPGTQNTLRTTTQQSNTGTNGTDILFASSNTAVPNISSLTQTTLNMPKSSALSTSSSSSTTTTTTSTTTATSSVGGSGVSGTPSNPFSLIVPVQLKSRATSSVHIFDLEGSYLISQITVKFNVLTKRPRYVRTLNVYTCDLTDRASARLIHEPQLWQLVASVRFSRNQTVARICFSHPSPVPVWLTANQEYATDKRITMNPDLVTDSFNLKQTPGLPIRASRLVFEYADFHSTGQEERRVCPRCHASDLQGSTCMMCHSNVNECFRCRSLNLSNEDVYLCANCGTSRHGKIEFSITAKPCYLSVEPLHDRDDRESACARILSLSRELGKISQVLSQLIQVDVTECLYRLCSLDTGVIDLTSLQESVPIKASPSLLSNNASGVGKAQTNSIVSNDPPQSTISSTNHTGFVNPAIIRLISSALKARAYSLDAAVITRRLWAARQSVVEFDTEEQHTSAVDCCIDNQSVRNDNKFFNSESSDYHPRKTQLNYVELDKMFYPSLSGCYWCLINTIYQCSYFLRNVAEFTALTMLKTVNKNAWDTSHWLFGTTTTTPTGVTCEDGDYPFPLFSVVSSSMVAATPTAINSVDIIRNLITNLIESGLNIYPQHFQQELRILLIYLTKDCHSLIYHLGNILSDRIVRTASIHGDQAHLLGPLLYNDVCLLQGSVESILPRKTQHGQLRKHSLDLSAEHWEARLRPVFKILLELSNNSVMNAPSIPVVQNILLPLVESLYMLASYKPSPSSLAFTKRSSIPIHTTATTTSNNVNNQPTEKDTISSLSVSKTDTDNNESQHDQLSNQSATPDNNFQLLQSSGHPPISLLSNDSDAIASFQAWLTNQPYASFEAWRKLKSIQIHASSFRYHTNQVDVASSSSDQQTISLWNNLNTKQINLVVRYAIRWKSIIEIKRWVKHWCLSATNCSFIKADHISSDSWLTKILFSPPDSNARGVYDCMKLLRQITSSIPVPKQTYTEVATCCNTQPVNPNFPKNLNVLFDKRRCAALSYLAEVCVPRLGELASTRDANLLLVERTSVTTTPSTSGPVSSSAVATSTRNNSFTPIPVALTAGDIFVTEFRHLTTSESSLVHSLTGRKLKQHTHTPTASTNNTSTGQNTIAVSRSPFIPYLLIKANFLRYVRILMRKLLLQITCIESVPVGHWNELMAATLSPISGSGACNGGAPAYAIALVAELLSVLKPLKQLTRSQQNQVLHILLPACAQLRYLVFQRTDCTVKAQTVFDSMLAELTGVSGIQIQEFLSTVLDVLAEYPVDDHQSATYLLQRLCTPVCPMDTDQTVFQIKLEVWRPHEDYLLARSRIEILPSDTRGLGPRIHNLIDFICDANNLTTDMRLEIVCEGQILMPQLRLHDVYTQIWCANRNNVNKPMRLRYRIPGLEADNLPYVENLSSEQIPPEQYSHISVLATHPHGLGDLLKRLASSQNAVYNRDLIDVIVHILEYCLKTPACIERLTDPGIKAIPRLLHTLIICLQSKQQKSSHHQQQSANIPEDITKRLIAVLKSLLELVDNKFNVMSSSYELSQSEFINLIDLNSVQFLLNFITIHPNISNVSVDVARLLGLMTFADERKMDAIIDFLKINLDQLKPSAQFNAFEVALLDCCCSLLFAIPKTSHNGVLFKQRVKQNAMLLHTSLHFLWSTFPLSCIDNNLDESSSTTVTSISNTTDPDVIKFLSEPSLPYVLQLLHVCVDGDQEEALLSQPDGLVETDRRRIEAYQLLRLFHQLEISKSSGRVGLLAEDMLNDWASTEDNSGNVSLKDSTDHHHCTIGQIVDNLRNVTLRRTRSLAHNMREKRLRSLNMRVNEKGQVAMVETDRLNKMTAVIQEETGLSCVICHEGLRIAPNEALGIYVYVRRCTLEENICMTGCEQAVTNFTNPPPNIPDGYSTLSNFVIVHFSCHTKSFKASSENEWIAAQRHNWDVGCNNILPILNPPLTGTVTAAVVSNNGGSGSSSSSSSNSKSSSKTGQQQAPDTVYAGHLANFMDFIMHKLNICPGYVMALHDIKLLLLRFACNRTFTVEAGGGGKESNMQLLPHLMQVYLHSLLMSSHVDQELEALKQFIEVPASYWAKPDKCWITTGPLYRSVVALHLWSRDEWLKHRTALLYSLLYMVVGRSNNNTTDDNRFIIIKPYLIYFGLIDSLYEYLFKNVSLTSSSAEIKSLKSSISSSGNSHSPSWPVSLSYYIRTSDEALMVATPKLLTYFEENLLTIANVDEFLDVTGLLESVTSEEIENIMKTL